MDALPIFLEKYWDPLFITDGGGKILAANPAAEKLSRVPHDNLIGRDFSTLFVEPSKAQELHERTLTEGTVREFPLNLRPEDDGAGEDLLAGTILLESEDPSKLKIYVILRDIGRHRKEEEKIRERQAHLETIFGNAPQAIVVINEEGIIVRWNPKAEQVFGWTKLEALGQPMHMLIMPPRYRELHQKGLKRFLETDEGPILDKTLELAAIRRDKSEFPIELRITVSQTGEERLFIAFLSDITERKEAEKKVVESEEKFNKAFTSSPAGILITRLSDRKFIDANHAVTEITGFSREEIIGHTSLELDMIENPGERQKLLEQISQHGSAKNVEMKLRHKSGRIIDIINSLDTIVLQGEKHILNVMYDVTEQKQTAERIKNLNRDLEQSVEQLRAANKELESFSYSISHDLRAPLRAVNGYSKMLENAYRDKLGGEGQRMIGVITESAQRMGHLIDDLLAFSRLGRKELEKTRVDVNAIVQSLLTEFTVSEGNAKAHILLKNMLPCVADATLLHQIFYNLISNALKYSRNREKPEIEIGSSAKDEACVYYVKDNGVGFNMAYYNKLFKVFQRLHSPQDFEGTGVGLAIVERIVSRHGGRVWAEGKENEGATFYFSLPKA